MTREELIKKIALKMDEISSSDDVIVPVGTGDNNPLYTQINNLLNESVNDVLMKAPIYRIQSQVQKLSATATTQNVFGGDRKVAVIRITEDFIRLVSIIDDAFQRPIIELAIEGDDVDKRQHNKFLVAKSAKPVAVIGRSADGARTITCYSYGEKQTPNPSVLYVKRYDNDTDTSASTDLDEYMTDIVSWVCAGKVFAAQGDINKGKICDENASALMI
jgi:hypothetical protein